MAKLVLGNDETVVTPAVYSKVDKQKFGVTIDTLLGSVDANGTYITPNTLAHVVDMSSVVTIPARSMQYTFWGAKIEVVNLSNLTTITTFSLRGAFGYSSIEAADISSLQVVGNAAMQETFVGCTSLRIVDMSNVYEIQQQGCYSAFESCSALQGINLDNLVILNGNTAASGMFEQSGLVTISLPRLHTATGVQVMYTMLGYCDRLTTANLGALQYASGQQCLVYLFIGDSALTSVDLSSLKKIDGVNPALYMFRGCASLPSMKFDSLSVLEGNQGIGGGFYNCTALRLLSFPAITNNTFATTQNQFIQMLLGCTDVVVHFPANVQTTIESIWGANPTFNGTNTTVLYDLPSTLLLNDSYRRNPKYDTATALAWGDAMSDDTVDLSTVYYTSGLADPAVGDTIYSDAECTTVKETISTAVSM